MYILKSLWMELRWIHWNICSNTLEPCIWRKAIHEQKESLAEAILRMWLQVLFIRGCPLKWAGSLFFLYMFVRRRLGSWSAGKKLAAQNLPRVKFFMGTLGSRRHYGHENAQKQVGHGRYLSDFGQQKTLWPRKCPKTGELWKMPVRNWAAQARGRSWLSKTVGD